VNSTCRTSGPEKLSAAGAAAGRVHGENHCSSFSQAEARGAIPKQGLLEGEFVNDRHMGFLVRVEGSPLCKHRID
jgi:hypothetical protein